MWQNECLRMGLRNNVAKFWLICGGFRQPLLALVRNADSPMRLWTRGDFAGNRTVTVFVTDLSHKNNITT